MTKEEAKQLVGLAAANFPALQDKDMRPTAILWQKMLEDIPYEVAEKAVLKVIATNRHFPTVAEIRSAVAEIMQPDGIAPGEAWGLVLETVRRYGFYRQKEALASLPEDVATAVRHLGWQEICLSEQPEIVRAQFMKVYEQVINRERQSMVMPREVKELAAKIAQRKALGSGKVGVLPRKDE